MSLLSDIEAEAASARKGPRCSIYVILDDFADPADADHLRAALDAGKPPRAIAVALHARGIKISKDTIRRHQRGDCSCL